MKTRNTSIDASSIADIAFILLAFIMIATTLKREEGIPAKLPEKSPLTPVVTVQERILEIYINKNEEIGIESSFGRSLNDVKEETKHFMTTDSENLDFSRFVTISEKLCLSKINSFQELQKQGAFYSDNDINTWKRKLETVKLLGQYQTLSKNSYITIGDDQETSYGAYLSIRDYILRGISELRNELGVEKFGITYDELKSKRIAVKTKEEISQQIALEQVYPSKIVKLKAKD